MRRRYVLALVLVTALIFALAGTAFGHYVVPRSKSDAAECLLIRGRIAAGFPNVTDSKASAALMTYYDDNCR